MLISIVIPVYNRADMVKTTLDSVKSQTHRPIHLVLVDNNSTDNTLQVLQNFKIENETQDFKIDVIEEKKQGASAARNAGAKLVNSEWLMFFDSDDTMDDCLVAKYAEKIKRNEVDLVCTAIDFTYKGKYTKSYIAKDNFLENHIFHSCLSTERYIVRKSVFEQSGGWDEELTMWDDWELGIRILLNKPRTIMLDDSIYVHVLAHSESISGLDYLSRIDGIKKALIKSKEIIKKSNLKSIGYYIQCIEFKKVLVAGLCRKEGNKVIASELFNEVYMDKNLPLKLKLLYKLLYKYILFGGRGSNRIAKKILKFLYV